MPMRLSSRLSVLALALTTASLAHADGPIVAWGGDASGPNADVDYVLNNVPSGSFKSVAAGPQAEAVGVRSDGTLQHWGRPNSGGVYAINPPTGQFTKAVYGNTNAAGLRSNGQIVPWGYNSSFVQPVPGGVYTDVSYNSNGTNIAAVRQDGSLAAWGYNTSGYEVLNQAPVGTFKRVFSGDFFHLAIRSDDTLVGWGYNRNGELDIPGGQFSSVSSSASFGYVVGIRSNGTLTAWGSAYSISSVFGPLPSGTFTKTVLLGNGFGLGLRTDGTLATWGLGPRNRPIITEVPKGQYTDIAASGANFALAIAAPVPEPASLAAVALGGGLLVRRRRR